MDTSKLLQFWPSSKQTYQERFESSARFVVYASLLAFLLRKDVRIIMLGVLVLLGMYIYYRLSPKSYSNYSTVSDNNPAGNYLMGDNPYRLPTRATSEEISQKLNLPSRWAERQFYTMPVTTAGGDLESFLAFNGRGQPNCRENQWMCTDEGNPRHPESVQLRGTFGGGVAGAGRN